MAGRPNPKRKILFVGLRVGEDHKGSDRWAELPEELEQWVGIDPMANRAAECPKFPSLSDLRTFSYSGKRLHSGIGPGAVIEVEYDRDDDGSVYPQTSKYLGMWPNHDDLATWKTEHSAHDLDMRMRKKAGQDARKEADLECLLPIREAMIRMSTQQRHLTIARVVRFLLGGSDLK